MKEEGKVIRISLESYKALLLLQKDLAKQVGFSPSISQIIKHLLHKETIGASNNVRER